MVGVPMFSGFISKLLFSQAAVESKHKMLITLISLAVSTILNAIYFMKTVIVLYTPESRRVIKDKNYKNITVFDQSAKSVALVLFVILNVALGLCSEPIVKLIETGLKMFS